MPEVPCNRNTEGPCAPSDCALIEHLTDGVVILSADQRIEFANSAAAAVVGIPASRLLGLSVWELLDPSQVEMVRKHLELRRQGETTRYEIGCLRPDGARRTLGITGIPRLNPDGSFAGSTLVVQDVTELHAARSAYRATEELFRISFENAAVGMALLGADGRWFRVNRALCSLLDRVEAELIGHSPLEFTHPDDVEASRQAFQQILDGGATPCQHEKRYLRPDGSVVWAEVSPALVRAAEGFPSCVFSQIKDITARKTAEGELRESRRLMERAQEVAHFGSWSSELAGGESIVWSPEVYRIFGLQPGEFDGRRESFLALVHPDDREAVRRASDASRADLGRYSIEHRIVWRDGTLRWVLEQADIYYDAEGRPCRLLGVVQDITERRAAESALRDSEERFRVVFERAAIGMCLAGPDGRLQTVNRALCKMLGYSEADLVGRSYLELTHPEDRESMARSVKSLLEGKRSVLHVEQRYVRRDGQVGVAVVDATVVRDSRGRPQHAVAHVQDVTEARRLEEQLRHAQQMEAVGRLAGSIAHDFNNLLTAILGYSDLMDMSLAPDHPASHAARQVRCASERASALTRQLLAFSRKQVLEPRVLCLNGILMDLEPMLRRVAGEDVELRMRLDPDLGRVKADAGQMQQVVMNLAINARDAMPEGGRLTLETRNVLLGEKEVRRIPDLSPGCYALLTVRDTGCGMDAETARRAFEPFFTTKEAGRGTGLGLPMVYGTVRQSGGAVTLDTAPGQGASFGIYLPLATAREQEQPPDAPPTSSTRRGHETVLIAEDDDAVRALLRVSLESAGYSVLAAPGGVEALRRLSEHPEPVHLLITDVIMPGMSGEALAARIAELRPGVPVLYVSGYTADTLATHGVLRDGTRLLPKPFTADQLLKAVRETLDSTS